MRVIIAVCQAIAALCLSSCLVGGGNSSGEFFSPEFPNIYALTFNGSNQYLERNATPVSGYPFTLSAWVKTSSATNQGVVGILRSSVTNRYFAILLTSTGTVQAECRNTSLFSATYSTAINDGRWHHVVAVFASNTSRELFVDGVSRATSTNSCTFDTSANRVSIGRYGMSTPNYYFNGSIDEVAVWNINLSAGEIAALYNAGKPTSLTSSFGAYVSSNQLVSWWRNGDHPNDNPSSTIYDNNGSNDMTASGMSGANLSTQVP